MLHSWLLEKDFSVISIASWHAQKICHSQICCTSLPAFLYMQCSSYVHQETCCTGGLFRVLSPKFGISSGCSHSNLSPFHLSVTLPLLVFVSLLPCPASPPPSHALPRPRAMGVLGCPVPFISSTPSPAPFGPVCSPSKPGIYCLSLPPTLYN